MGDQFSILEKKRRGCRGCLITVWIVILAFIGFSIYVTRLPFYKPYEECSKNCINALIPALGRYYSHNNRYPDSLAELQGEYLKDKNAVYCPLHKDKKAGYIYIKPDSPEYGGVVLKCREHRIFDKKTELAFTLKGKIRARITEKER